MRLVGPCRQFHDDEDGAVTVDWVVLTAAVIGLGIMAMATVSGGMTILVDKIAHSLGYHIHPG